MTTSKTTAIALSLLTIGLAGGCSRGAGPALPPTSANAPAAAHASAGFQTVYSFAGEPDGAAPNADLIAAGGMLVGTTATGGASDIGTVFRSTTAGAEQVLFSFSSSTINSPNDGVIDVGGQFYGTASQATFAVNTLGQERVLHQLAGGLDGYGEQGPLASFKGELYGATQLGGSNHCNSGCGTVYASTVAGTQRVVHYFDGKGDGFDPQGGLIVMKGALYGTTSYGGTHDAGTVYRITSSGSKEIVYDFANLDDGSYPSGKPTASNGTLYVSARYGGAHAYGVILAIAPSGKATVLHGFLGGGDGRGPNGGLAFHKGILYGTTAEGGTADKGTIFALTKAGKKTVLHDFRGGDGATPQAGLVFLNGRFYGTTFAGGSADHGTIFSFSPL